MTKRKGTNTGIPGLSFSWRRAVGITKVKRDIARMTGIPTTRSGRQRKIGRMAMGGLHVPDARITGADGCGTALALLALGVTVLSIIFGG